MRRLQGLFAAYGDLIIPTLAIVAALASIGFFITPPHSHIHTIEVIHVP